MKYLTISILFNTCLILQKGNETVIRTDKFTVRYISDTNLERTRIVYFSICSTAENRAEKLVDNIIYFVSGFLIAEFSHVIASIWVTDDEICVKMVREFLLTVEVWLR
jgi:CHAT domain-containing protein